MTVLTSLFCWLVVNLAEDVKISIAAILSVKDDLTNLKDESSKGSEGRSGDITSMRGDITSIKDSKKDMAVALAKIEAGPNKWVVGRWLVYPSIDAVCVLAIRPHAPPS